MTTATKPTRKTITGLPETAEAAPILGEVINWEMPEKGFAISLSHLRDALQDAGLDAGLARDLAPRNVFARAARKMLKDRIIRKVEEDETVIRFQFTAEQRESDGLRYDREAIVGLDKATGVITCDDPTIGQRARDEFDAQIGVRYAADVTRLVKRMFEDKRKADLDLIPMSSYANFYFVRASREGFVDQVEDFVGRVGGRMLRLRIAAGTPAQNQGVKDAVAAKMSSLLDEYQTEVDGFGKDTRDSSLQSAAERIRILQFKIDSYAEYLGDARDRLTAQLTEARKQLKAKIVELA